MGISIVKPFGEADLVHSPSLLSRLDKSGHAAVVNFARNFLSSSTPPFFAVEVETINRCNNDCPFCPVNRNNDTRKPARMDEALFKSIIDQLAHMNYSGYLSLYSNNEPLLDNRIFDFIAYARKRVPYARHALYTNGTLLDEEKFQRLIENLGLLIIDNYDDNFQLMPNIQKIFDANANKNFACNVNISLRKKNQKLNTRGGKAPNRINEENKFRPRSACILPFTQLIIRPDGTIGKCCNDPLSEFVLGDLKTQTLLEVWRGKPYQEFRKEMFFNGRQRIAGCEFCDIFGLYNYLPDSAFVEERKRVSKELALRKNLGEIYIFDTIPLSRAIMQQLELLGVKFDGVVDIRNTVDRDKNLRYITLEQALNSKVFLLIPTPNYDDSFFDILDSVGYQYEKDYLIY